MVQWNDSNINWQSLNAREIRRLINTWGKDAAEVKVTKATKAPAKKAAPKKAVAKPTRQRHSGADGEVKFVAHRNLYVGFWGNKVVVTKRTEAACREFLKSEFGAE